MVDNRMCVLYVPASIYLRTYTSLRNEPIWPGSEAELELSSISLVDYAYSEQYGGLGCFCCTYVLASFLAYHAPEMPAEIGIYIFSVFRYV